MSSSVCSCLKKGMLDYVLQIVNYLEDFYHIPFLSSVFKLVNDKFFLIALHKGDFGVIV